MNKCIIFLSRKENYIKSAIKIKKDSEILVNIIYIEDFIKIIDKEKILENSIIYFLCNSILINEILESAKHLECYIFNKYFFENKYTKIEIQNILISNKIRTPRLYKNYKIDEFEFPIFCKENRHAGIVFKAYTKETIIRFFEKFNQNNFYLEESLNIQEEVKFYYINGKVYSKINILGDVNEDCIKIAKVLNLEIFSVDFIKYNNEYYIIDVNPSAGFYMLDNARMKFIDELKNIIIDKE